LRAVDNQSVFDARITGGNYEWLTIDGESDMTDKSFVENLIDCVALMTASFGQTLQGCAWRLGELCHRWERLVYVFGVINE